MSYLRRNSLRLLLGTLAVLGGVFASAWVPLLAMTLLALRYRAIEVLFIGVGMDFLWLPLSGGLPLFTLAGFLLVWGLEPLRSEFLILRP